MVGSQARGWQVLSAVIYVRHLLQLIRVACNLMQADALFQASQMPYHPGVDRFLHPPEEPLLQVNLAQVWKYQKLSISIVNDLLALPAICQNGLWSLPEPF